MNEIVFYCSPERPDVVERDYAYTLNGHTAGSTEKAICRHAVNPADIEARDERVLEVARWLAEHLTSTLRSAQGDAALKLVGIQEYSERERRIFGLPEGPLTTEWDFDMLRVGVSPEQYLREEASRIIDLHAREGIQRAELNGAVLEFGDFERITVRAAASRYNGKKGGRPQADPERKLTRMGVSIYADQQQRLRGENLSELIRRLLDAHIATLPEQSD